MDRSTPAGLTPAAAGPTQRRRWPIVLLLVAMIVGGAALGQFLAGAAKIDVVMTGSSGDHRSASIPLRAGRALYPLLLHLDLPPESPGGFELQSRGPLRLKLYLFNLSQPWKLWQRSADNLLRGQLPAGPTTLLLLLQSPGPLGQETTPGVPIASCCLPPGSTAHQSENESPRLELLRQGTRQAAWSAPLSLIIK